MNLLLLHLFKVGEQTVEIEYFFKCTEDRRCSLFGTPGKFNRSELIPSTQQAWPKQSKAFSLFDVVTTPDKEKASTTGR
ncbi:hypothetical protein SAMN05428967_2161 [Phyllobacterium sp. YR620]|nr:hypothetical protein SAMN05428967_2161 [Phyllobacterium sp. YR620]